MENIGWPQSWQFNHYIGRPIHFTDSWIIDGEFLVRDPVHLDYNSRIYWKPDNSIMACDTASLMAVFFYEWLYETKSSINFESDSVGTEKDLLQDTQTSAGRRGGRLANLYIGACNSVRLHELTSTKEKDSRNILSISFQYYTVCILLHSTWYIWWSQVALVAIIHFHSITVHFDCDIQTEPLTTSSFKQLLTLEKQRGVDLGRLYVVRVHDWPCYMMSWKQRWAGLC